MAKQSILARLKRQTQRASGFQKCASFSVDAANDFAEHFGRDEILYESPQYKDVGQIIFLGGSKETAAVDFYSHDYRELIDPDLYKMRENKDKRQRLPHSNDPRAVVVLFHYDVIERGTKEVVGEVITRRFRCQGVRGGNEWALVSITFRGQHTRILPAGAI